MAKTIEPIRVIITVLLAVCVYPLHAWQAEPSQIGHAVSTQETAPQSAGEGDEKPSPEQTSQSAPALDSNAAISMSALRGTRLLAGATVLGGFDTNPENSINASGSTLYTFVPYIGLEGGAQRTQYVLQYRPMINRLSGYTTGTLHTASINVVSNVTERWSWTLGMIGSQGQDALRLLATGTPQNSASYLPNAGSETNLDGKFDLRYLVSAKNTLTLHLEDAYNSVAAFHESSSVASSTLYYNHSLSERFAILGFGQLSEYYGDLACWAVGGGFGILWHPGEGSVISLTGGPQLNSSRCQRQQGFSYDASLSKTLPRRSRVYFLGSRQPVSGNLGAGLWQDGVSGGYQRQIFGASIVSADVGYAHSSTLLNASNYRGTYFEASYSHPLRGNIYFGSTYRSFVGDSGGTGFSRYTLIGQLTFTPNVPYLLSR